MNLDDVKNTIASYCNEDESRLCISVITENEDSNSISAHTSLHGNPIEIGAVLAYVMHTDESFYRIIKNALRAVDKIKNQDAEKSHNS